MYAKTPDLVLRYRRAGAAATCGSRCLEARKETCERLLDFACGYGRALRYFRAAFPDARLDRVRHPPDAVDFCAQEFDAVPVYSHGGPGRDRAAGPVRHDLGRVAVHARAAGPAGSRSWTCSSPVLAENGLLLFTVQGRNVRRQILSGQVAWDLAESDIEQIVRGYDETGYGYADWSGAAATAHL